MKKIIAIAMATVMVIGCSFSALAYDDPNKSKIGININAGNTLVDNGTRDGLEAGTVNINNGTITYNNAMGTVSTNKGTIETNNGQLDEPSRKNNHGVYNNYGTITTNNGFVSNNYASGTISTNEVNGLIATNNPNATVITNNGKIGDECPPTRHDTGNYGTVTTNNGTIETNRGTGTVTTNAADGLIETNDGTVITNDIIDSIHFGLIKMNNGTVITNNGGIETNKGTVGVNNGEMGNESEGTVETNTSYVYNKGIVKTNTLTGTTDLSSGGTVTNNYGTVRYAKVDEAGNIVYDATSKLYGVTYGETPESLYVFKNEQVAEVITPSAETTNYTVLTAEDANASKSGYKFINWVLRTATAEDLAKYTATTYVGGEQITVVSPIWLEAVWEKLPDEVKKSYGATFTIAPISQGSSSAPITSGTWAQASNGKFTYTNNGEKLINCTAWIQYTDANGQVVTGKFCFDNNGYMIANTWKQVSDGVWNYFGADGKMVTNTTTPDGYVVDANGEWRK